MEQKFFSEKTDEFNLRLEDEKGENWHNAEGVIAVELPVIAVELPKSASNENWVLHSITPVRIFFTTVEAAIAVVKAKETHLRIRAAEQVYDRLAVEFGFKGREHILTVERPCVRFSPGKTKRGEPAYAMCEFSVKKYSMKFDGEETLYASVEDGTLQIK